MALIRLNEHLRLERCPFCNVDRPNLDKQTEFRTTDSEGGNDLLWRFYKCARCGGVVSAAAEKSGRYTKGIFPSTESVADALPSKAKSYLSQATQSLHAPAGAMMLAASAVDAMLKAKDYAEGSLYSRIEKAVSDHLITPGMAQWAHQVRLDANDQRHADEAADLPTAADAKRCIEFTKALGQFLFVLPALVDEGIEKTKPEEEKPTTASTTTNGPAAGGSI